MSKYCWLRSCTKYIYIYFSCLAVYNCDICVIIFNSTCLCQWQKLPIEKKLISWFFYDKLCDPEKQCREVATFMHTNMLNRSNCLRRRGRREDMWKSHTTWKPVTYDTGSLDQEVGGLHSRLGAVRSLRRMSRVEYANHANIERCL